jgi:pimeloyl-ACP methyl ester carboxylesterase
LSLIDPDGVSPYDRLVWPEGAIEQLLATGQRRREVIAYLGEHEYQSLKPMAAAAASTPAHRNHCVFIVPGIMGSQLGLPRQAPLPDNLLWVDPIDIQQGNLGLLALPGPEIRSCGPVLYNYLALKFALQIAGFTVRFFDYDWRRDLQELGIQLAARIEAQFTTQPDAAISLVGHSMGGLVGRTALLNAAGARVQRLVTLGAPHDGSFAPVQALRGVYPLVRRIAQLDPVRSAETLARDVFATFHSLYQMLPRPHVGLDLLDPRNWPRTGPQPNATLLARVPMLQLGAADRRIVAVAGYGFYTVVNAALVHDDFFYRLEPGGDGTVPTARAVMPGVPAWYCRVAHSELPRNSAVQAAVVALLAGETPVLSTSPGQEPATGFAVSDRELREQFVEKIDWAQLTPAARRHFLDSLNEPPPMAPARRGN